MALFSPSSVLILPFLIKLICPACKFTFARDTLLPGQSLNAIETLQSENGAFKLGFNCSAPSNRCAIGIWFTNSSSCSYDYLSVWEPDLYCSCDSSSISLSEKGILQMNDSYGTLVSISNYMRTTSNSTAAVLLDNGNLVVRDQVNSSMVLWQSFDYPTGKLISGGHLGFNSITGNNVSISYPSIWDNRYPTEYTLILEATRRRGFIIQRNLIDLVFAGVFPSWMDIHEDGDNALTLDGTHTYMRLNSSGFIEFGKQNVCSSVLWSAPESLCDFDSYCGPYSLCTRSGSCMCPFGFVSQDTGEWKWIALGCSGKMPMNCERGVSTHQETKFYPIDGVYKFPHNSWTSDARSMKECETSCTRDCTCTAFAYNTTCLLWFVELRNTVVHDSGSNGNRLYIRIATNQQQNSSARVAPQSSNQTKVIVLSLMSTLAVTAIVLIFLWKCQIKLLRAKPVYENESLMVFSFSQLKNSTNNFSEKLGEGGFGSVFKGTVLGSMTVAVKKLKDLRQGEKQFRTEVQTVGMIQHNNLVRLLGFCADGSNRLLVYEYLTSGSLNSHLFSGNSTKLSWELRYKIALGTAKGLAYLHEECKDCIVHCDMKPDNILLDEEFCPKIADFGMAKLLGRDFSRVLTTMRGSIGYLAPEWISGLPITHKADVYSYGMMLLEIISGRRNSEKIKEGKHTYFPIYAACKLNEGDAMCLLDNRLEGNADAEQLERACRIACWCIQDAEDQRPMMGQVVLMLEGAMDVLIPPVLRSLQNFVGMEDSI